MLTLEEIAVLVRGDGGAGDVVMNTTSFEE